MTAADYPDFQSPQAHATQIAATGVPLLVNGNLLSGNASLNIPPGPPFQTPGLSILQPSYEISVEAKTGVAPASPWLESELTWFDAPGGNIVELDRFWLPIGNPGYGPVTYGRGPSKGTQVFLSLFNTDATQTANVNYRLLQTSRVFTRDVWHWDNEGYGPNLVNGYTLPTFGFEGTNLGLLSGVTIPASSTKTYLFAPWDGLIQIVSQVTTGAASSLTVNIRPQPDSNFATTPITFQSVGVAPNGQFVGARAPLRVDLINAATSAIVVNLALWAIR